MKYAASTIKKHRRAWVKALRSGEYKQAEGCLCETNADGDTFCCLGVATDLAKVREVEPIVLSGRYEGVRRRVYASEHVGVSEETTEYLTLPKAAQEWLGVTTGDPYFGYNEDSEDDRARLVNVLGGDADDLTDRLCLDDPITGATLNDAGFTFDQIADAYEAFGFSPRHDLLVLEAA